MKTILLAIIINSVNLGLLASVQDFSAPSFLAKQVRHWEDVYGTYDSNEVIFYDQDSFTVYDKLVLPKIPGELSFQRYRKDVEARKKDVLRVLKQLASQEKPNSEDGELYKQIKKRLERNKINDYARLSERLKWQNGLKSQFALGLKESGKYIRDVEATLQENNLPKELAWGVPMLESFYFPGTESSKSAVGIWGLLKETARINGIHVNNFVEERRDPVLATKASASYFKKAKEYLKEWPLAITSYNCGLPGMIRASQNLNTTDLEKIIEQHDSPIFGFASQNYASSFYAILNILKRQDELFPDLVKEKPWSYDFVELTKPVLATDLIRAGGISKEELRALNPAFTKRTLEGLEVIPSQYTMRVPKGTLSKFNNAIRTIPVKKRLKDGIKISHKYRANGRATLAQIAKDLGIAIDFLTSGLKQGPRYKPKGIINIRSGYHEFSQIKPNASEAKVLTTKE